MPRTPGPRKVPPSLLPTDTCSSRSPGDRLSPPGRLSHCLPQTGGWRGLGSDWTSEPRAHRCVSAQGDPVPQASPLLPDTPREPQGQGQMLTSKALFFLPPAPRKAQKVGLQVGPLTGQRATGQQDFRMRSPEVTPSAAERAMLFSKNLL